MGTHQLALLIKCQAKFRSLIYSRAMQDFADQKTFHLRKYLDVVLIWGVILNAWIAVCITGALVRNAAKARGPPAFLLDGHMEQSSPVQYSHFGQDCDWGGSEFNKTGLRTLYHTFPISVGREFFAGFTIVHLVNAHLLFVLFFFGAFRVFRRTFGHRPRAVRVCGRSLQVDTALLLHNFFLALQITLGLISGGYKLQRLGVSFECWWVITPSFKLDLYLQFISLGGMSVYCIMQSFALRTIGFLDVNPPSRRNPLLVGWRVWRLVAVLVCNILSMVWSLAVLIIFFVFVRPYDPSNHAYLIVFCIQVPIFVSYSALNLRYWTLSSQTEKLLRWQRQMNRSSAMCLYVTISTYLANVGLRTRWLPLPGITYGICDVLLAAYLLLNERKHQPWLSKLLRCARRESHGLQEVSQEVSQRVQSLVRVQSRALVRDAASKMRVANPNPNPNPSPNPNPNPNPNPYPTPLPQLGGARRCEIPLPSDDITTTIRRDHLRPRAESMVTA